MPAPAPAEAIIRVRDITVQFGKRRVLDGLDLDVKRGAKTAVHAPVALSASALPRLIRSNVGSAFKLACSCRPYAWNR